MTWYELALSLPEPLDYSEFARLAEQGNITHSLDKHGYLCRIGRVLGEKLTSSPDVDIHTLFNTAMDIKQVVPTPSFMFNERQQTCCGGGEVK